MNFLKTGGVDSDSIEGDRMAEIAVPVSQLEKITKSLPIVGQKSQNK